MRRRLVSTLLILGLGLLPGVPAVACPSDRPEAAGSHAHADHSHAQSGHHHSAGAAPRDHVPQSTTTADPGSPAEEPSGHSGPVCCRASSQAVATTAWEGVRIRTLDGFSAPPVVVVLALEPLRPTVSVRDPRSLRPDERRSPYVRTRAPLLI